MFKPESPDDGETPSRDETLHALPEVRRNTVGVTLLRTVIALCRPPQAHHMTGLLLEKGV